jgi:hypothetical protein
MSKRRMTVAEFEEKVSRMTQAQKDAAIERFAYLVELDWQQQRRIERCEVDGGCVVPTTRRWKKMAL